MMNYQIHITRIAEEDLNEAADYIEFVLKNPQAAAQLIDLAEDEINSLAANPKIHAVVDDAVLRSWRIRFAAVNNYLVFYTVDEASHCIFVVRFLYGKRNWVTMLRQGIRFY